MRRYRLILGVALALGLTVAAIAARASAAPASSRVFELRTYTAAPGKFDALHARFRNHANGLFAKHGMAVIGYWQATEKPDTLVYILAHKDRHAADESWKAFVADPEWTKAKAESEVNGSLTTKVESVYMAPTDYSPMK